MSERETIRPPAYISHEATQTYIGRINQIKESLRCSLVAAKMIADGKATVTIDWGKPGGSVGVEAVLR